MNNHVLQNAAAQRPTQYTSLDYKNYFGSGQGQKGKKLSGPRLKP